MTAEHRAVDVPFRVLSLVVALEAVPVPSLALVLFLCHLLDRGIGKGEDMGVELEKISECTGSFTRALGLPESPF